MFEDLIPSAPAAPAPPPGMFDDLIPAGGTTGAAAGGMFDDLIPRYEPVPDPQLGLKDAKTGIPLVRDIKPGGFIADIAGADDGGVYWKDPGTGAIRRQGPGELILPQGGRFKVYAREETVRPWTLGDMDIVKGIASGLTAPRDVFAGDVAPTEVVPRALDFAALAAGAGPSTIRTWRPRVPPTSAPAEPLPESAAPMPDSVAPSDNKLELAPTPPSQQQIADNRAKVVDSLNRVGIPPDRIDPLDIQGAARPVTRRDVLTLDAFRRAVIGDALERGFATPQEVDRVYGGGTADEYRSTSAPANGAAATPQGVAAPRSVGDAPQSQQLPRPGEDDGNVGETPSAGPGATPAPEPEADSATSERGGGPARAAERQPIGPAESPVTPRTASNDAVRPEETVRPDGVSGETAAADRSGGNVVRSRSPSLSGTEIDVYGNLFEELGLKPGRFYANYDSLSRKHPEYLPSAEAAKAHVEHVLSHPDVAIPQRSGNLDLIARSAKGDKLIGFKAQLKNNRYDIRTAYILSEGQLTAMKEGAARAGATVLELNSKGH